MTMSEVGFGLDMIFVDSDEFVVGTVTAPAYSQGPYAVDKTRMVVETRAGFCRKNGITPGSRVEVLRL